jgi:hypothetical protein
MKNIKLIVKDFCYNIKNFIVKIFSILIKIILNRLNQDCFSKRLYRTFNNIIKNIKLPWFYKGRQDFIPLIILIFSKVFLSLILYMSILDIISI